MRRAPRRARAAVLAGMAIVTTGCDYLVDPDGRIRFTYVSLDERNRVLACLEAAGRDTERLPDPLAVSPSGK